MRRIARIATVLACCGVLVVSDILSACTSSSTPNPRRGAVEVAMPAYVDPGSPMLTSLADATVPPGIVILNPGNGDKPFGAKWWAPADRLRAHGSEVLGYVYTDYGKRSIAAVEASIDNYLETADHTLHVDGILIDMTTSVCGSAPGRTDYRDYYLTLENYVRETMRAVRSGASATVVDNPGSPVDPCYLTGADRTADTFVTYEGDYRSYLAGDSGNVSTAKGTDDGTGYAPSSFWHLVSGVPNEAAMRTVVSTAWSRRAGWVYATLDRSPPGWDTLPPWGIDAETSYADLLSKRTSPTSTGTSR